MALCFLPACVKMRITSPAFLAGLRLSRALSTANSLITRRTLSSSLGLLASKAKVYAVKVGRVPGVYSTWAEAEEQVKGARLPSPAVHEANVREILLSILIFWTIIRLPRRYLPGLWFASQVGAASLRRCSRAVLWLISRGPLCDCPSEALPRRTLPAWRNLVRSLPAADRSLC